MNIKEFLESQLKQVNRSKEIELIKVESFYQGAEVALNSVANYVAQEEAKEAAQKNTEETKKEETENNSRKSK